MKRIASERLTEILENGIDVHRCAAARALGDFGLPETVQTLVKALLDEDSDVRADAAAALAKMNDPATAEKLMDNLQGDPEASVKKAAIEALVVMRYEAVIPLLRSLTVSRSDDKIAWDEDDFYATGWDDWTDIQLAAIRGLEVFAPEDAVPEIVEAMSDDMAQDISEPGLRTLSKMGQAGALAIIDFYGKGDERMCRRIARIVGASGNKHLADLKAGLIKDSDASVRAIAITNLAVTDTDLAPLFADKDALVRAAAVKHAGKENTLLLWDLINDPAPEVRVEVFKVIAADPEKFQDKDLIKAVQKTIKGEPKAAKEAVFALIALKGPKAVNGLLPVISNKDVPREFRIGVLEAFEVAGDVGVPTLLSVAGDDDRQLRLTAMTALAQIASSSAEWPNVAGDGLLLALEGKLVLAPEEEEMEEVEEVVVEELGEDEVAEINKEIDDSFPLVEDTSQTLSTLDAIKANVPVEVEEEVEELVLDAETERMLALTKTRRHAKRKVSWDVAAAPHQDVQRFSARLLGGIVNDDVTSQLVETLALDIDDETRTAVLFSLAKHGEIKGSLPNDILETVIALLAHDDSEVRVLATRTLGWISDKSIDAKLEELLTHTDPLVRTEAVHALDNRNTVIDAMIEALNDSYLGVGIAAARSLARQYGDDAVDALVLFAVTNDGTYRRDIGQLLAQYAPDAGAKRLLELLADEDQKARWLVAIDALAELFKHSEDPDLLQVA